MSEDADEDLAVKAHGVARRLGDRVFQCDATAVCTMPGGTRAYALPDGVGDTPAVRAWTRTAARRLARAAAGHGDAEAGLRTECERYAANPARHDLPAVVAVVAVHVPGGLFTVAWSGDARAYLLLDGLGPLRQITKDHNARRACDGLGDRNLITACLGGIRDDEETEQHWGRPTIEYMIGPARPGHGNRTRGAHRVCAYRSTYPGATCGPRARFRSRVTGSHPVSVRSVMKASSGCGVFMAPAQ
ncbi:hypothetical protein ACFQ9J_15965 [Streptomyces sp. NPDC056529]|uniref:hypothetical protein n=1 Tax=Streptomyces sp. NPDC056529 TaxID=3345855 RepID=UPI0036A20AD4